MRFAVDLLELCLVVSFLPKGPGSAWSDRRLVSGLGIPADSQISSGSTSTPAPKGAISTSSTEQTPELSSSERAPTVKSTSEFHVGVSVFTCMSELIFFCDVLHCWFAESLGSGLTTRVNQVLAFSEPAGPVLN